jgi:hypothetical protein
MTPFDWIRRHEAWLLRSGGILAILVCALVMSRSRASSFGLLPWLVIVFFPGEDLRRSVRESGRLRGVDDLEATLRGVSSRLTPPLVAVIVFLLTSSESASFLLAISIQCFVAVSIGMFLARAIDSPRALRWTLLGVWSVLPWVTGDRFPLSADPNQAVDGSAVLANVLISIAALVSTLERIPLRPPMQVVP